MEFPVLYFVRTHVLLWVGYLKYLLYIYIIIIFLCMHNALLYSQNVTILQDFYNFLT